MQICGRKLGNCGRETSNLAALSAIRINTVRLIDYHKIVHASLSWWGGWLQHTFLACESSMQEWIRCFHDCLCRLLLVEVQDTQTLQNLINICLTPACALGQHSDANPTHKELRQATGIGHEQHL
jgi:hypothetical protein